MRAKKHGTKSASGSGRACLNASMAHNARAVWPRRLSVREDITSHLSFRFTGPAPAGLSSAASRPHLPDMPFPTMPDHGVGVGNALVSDDVIAISGVLWHARRHRARFKGGGTPTADRTRVQELVNAALDLPEDPRTHTLLAKIYLFDKDDHARAEAEARKAIDIDPNSSEGLATLAEILLYTNQVEAATEILQMSMRLNPGFPNSYQILLAQAWFEQKRYRDVINLLETVCEGASIWRHYRTCRYYRASAHGHLGELKSGREGTDLYIFSDGWETVIVIWFPFKYESSREHLMEGVRKILQDN